MCQQTSPGLCSCCWPRHHSTCHGKGRPGLANGEKMEQLGHCCGVFERPRNWKNACGSCYVLSTSSATSTAPIIADLCHNVLLPAAVVPLAGTTGRVSKIGGAYVWYWMMVCLLVVPKKTEFAAGCHRWWVVHNFPEFDVSPHWFFGFRDELSSFDRVASWCSFRWGSTFGYFSCMQFLPIVTVLICVYGK
jgi:hypothetical protein